MGWSSSVSVWGQFSTDGSSLALWSYSSVEYSVHQFTICRSSVRHFPEWPWTVVAFPHFTVIKSFIRWYALLLLFFLRFSSISLHCSPIQFSLAFFMHLLTLLFTSLYFSDSSGSNLFFLSSLLCRTDQEFLQWPRVFPSDDVCYCCVEGGDHLIYVCIYIVHDIERCKLPTYHSLDSFQHIGIFQLFQVKLESCVFWLAYFYQTKAEGHHQQVVITSNVCSWKVSSSGTVHSWWEALPH